MTVRWKILDRQYDCTASWEPAGEAEAVPAGEQTAEGVREAKDGVLRTAEPEFALPLADLFNPPEA